MKLENMDLNEQLLTVQDIRVLAFVRFISWSDLTYKMPCEGMVTFMLHITPSLSLILLELPFSVAGIVSRASSRINTVSEAEFYYNTVLFLTLTKETRHTQGRLLSCQSTVNHQISLKRNPVEQLTLWLSPAFLLLSKPRGAYTDEA